MIGAIRVAFSLILLCGTLAPQVAAAQATSDSKNSNTVQKSTGTKARSPAKTQAKRRAINKSVLFPPPVIYKYNEPGDLINLFPILKEINEMIPRQFSLADHEFVLDTNRIVIRHSFYDTPRSRAASKFSVVTFTYSGNIGRQFSTNLDVPLFYSSIFGFSDWSRYPLGNYTMTFSRDNFLANETYYIRAITKF